MINVNSLLILICLTILNKDYLKKKHKNKMKNRKKSITRNSPENISNINLKELLFIWVLLIQDIIIAIFVIEKNKMFLKVINGMNLMILMLNILIRKIFPRKHMEEKKDIPIICKASILIKLEMHIYYFMIEYFLLMKKIYNKNNLMKKNLIVKI